eukprot:731419-Prymnesium_polylepis.1
MDLQPLTARLEAVLGKLAAKAALDPAALPPAAVRADCAARLEAASRQLAPVVDALEARAAATEAEAA